MLAGCRIQAQSEASQKPAGDWGKACQGQSFTGGEEYHSDEDDSVDLAHRIEKDLSMHDYVLALLGGALIGAASVAMLFLNGKILGISGIVGGLLHKSKEPKQWRYLFLLGLLAGGMILLSVRPEVFQIAVTRSPLVLIVAGLLVGFGTRLGGGCTSGHGICGISRLSPRSLMATLTFMASGAAVVFVINHCFGGRV